MDDYELFVCSEFLSSYPDHLTFGDIMELLYSLDTEVEVWQPFEDMSMHDLVDNMVGMLQRLREGFVIREEVKQ